MVNLLNFFADTTDTAALPYLTIIFRIFFSFVAGFVFGYERKSHQHPVGLRTLILISVGSTVLMLLSIHMATLFPGKVDSSRIAAQAVSGIGFLGGGAILRYGRNIRGLTSAAIIWAASAIGLAIGAGMYVVSICSLVLCICALLILHKFESMYFPTEDSKILLLRFKGTSLDFDLIRDVVKKCGFKVSSQNVETVVQENETKITFSVRAPDFADINPLMKELQQKFSLEEIALRD
jgi:putative Mg2+ transporter-C (MgtC) family protein